MNRWISWASRIRRRHGRRERGALPQTMALAHRAAMIAPARFVTNRRTIIQVHAHLGVTSVPAPAMLLRGEPVPKAPGTLRVPWAADGRSASSADASAERSGAVRSTSAESPAFIRPDAVSDQVLRGPSRRRSLAVDRRSENSDGRALPIPVLSLRRRPTLTAEHADIPRRLRRQATREEMAIPGRTTVLARTSPPPAVGAQRDHIDREQTVTSRADWPTLAPPPLNVEALTSQVIQQLDRRLLAYRERMGRV